MSATRDPSQKHTFVYSNLYQLYQKGKVAAKEAVIPEPIAATVAPIASASAPVSVASAAISERGIVTGKIIKADELAPGVIGLRVARHEPPSLLGKRLNPAPASRSRKVDPTRREAIDGLRDNLRSLQNLHERLRFMLKEIEDLSKE